MYKIQIKHDGEWLSGLQYPEHKLVECLEKMQRLEQEGKEVRFFIVGKKIQWVGSLGIKPNQTLNCL